jgi:hypothetical protein
MFDMGDFIHIKTHSKYKSYVSHSFAAKYYKILRNYRGINSVSILSIAADFCLQFFSLPGAITN